MNSNQGFGPNQCWSQFQNLNENVLSKHLFDLFPVATLVQTQMDCSIQKSKWTAPSRSPIYEYQLSQNLINACQELNFFIFKYGDFHIIMYFQSPLLGYFTRTAFVCLNTNHTASSTNANLQQPGSNFFFLISGPVIRYVFRLVKTRLHEFFKFIDP